MSWQKTTETGFVVDENKPKTRTAFNVTLQDVGFSQIMNVCNLNDKGRNKINIRKSYEDDVLNRHHFDTGINSGI